jgi:hypothetical protein
MPVESAEQLTAFAERLESQLPDGFRSIAGRLPQRWLIVNDTEAIQDEIEDLGGYWHVALSPGDVGVELPAADPLVERLIRTLGLDQIYEVASRPDRFRPGGGTSSQTGLRSCGIRDKSRRAERPA